MTYLIDTNVLSELARSEPNPGVRSWAGTAGRVAVSVITAEEIHFGLSWKPKPKLEAWLDGFLDNFCDVFPVTLEVARVGGRLRGRFQERGQTRSQADMLIAATALIHGLTLVTRNTADFAGCGISLLDPFT